MATRLAILATAQAIRDLLAEAGAGTEFADCDFKVVQAAELGDETPVVAEGLTVCLYQVSASASQHNTPPRPGPTGQHSRAAMALELHFLLTPWSASAEQQLGLLGWALRVLDDTPILTANFLNAGFPGQVVFQPDESVELSFNPLSLHDLARLAESLRQPRVLDSISYLARPVSIDSTAAAAV
jgi:hypothetical protein